MLQVLLITLIIVVANRWWGATHPAAPAKPKAPKPLKPPRTWKDWLGVGIYVLTALIAFAFYFPTAALWVLVIAFFLAVGSIMPYAIASDAKGKAKRQAALIATADSTCFVSSAEPTAPHL
jgi:hypothetical protein